MMLAAVISLIDRQILALLILPIRADLKISDTQVSFLQGFAFAALYAVFGVALGHLADTVARGRLIVFGLIGWSVMTVMCGLSHTYWQLFSARLGVGIGEACLHPAAYSLISDYFRPQQRGRAYSMFTLAGQSGLALSLIGGALLLLWLGNASTVRIPVVGITQTWKVIFIIAGLPGILLASLMIAMREPPRREMARPPNLAESATRMTLSKFLRENLRPIALVFVVHGLISCVGFAVMAWMTTAYVRVFGITLVHAAFICGGILLVGALVGAPLGGYLADRFTERQLLGGKLLVPAFGGAIGGALFVAWWLVGDLTLSVVLGVAGFIVQVAMAATAPSALNELVPNELRGKMSALYLMVNSLFGFAAGPTAVALLTDYVFGYDQAVRYSLAAISILVPIAGAIGWLGRRTYSNAVAKRNAACDSSLGLTGRSPSVAPVTV